jgi:hypothetical protein
MLTSNRMRQAIRSDTPATPVLSTVDITRSLVGRVLSADIPLLSPNPFLSYGLNAAEPHIRSPLIMAGTKIPHT